MVPLLAGYDGAHDLGAGEAAPGEIGGRQARELGRAVVQDTAVADARQYVGEMPGNARLTRRSRDQGAVGESVQLQHRDLPWRAQRMRALNGRRFTDCSPRRM